MTARRSPRPPAIEIRGRTDPKIEVLRRTDKPRIQLPESYLPRLAETHIELGPTDATIEDADAPWPSYTGERYKPGEVNFSALMSEFSKIAIPGIGFVPGSRSAFEAFIETPALRAVQALYDKNIRTVSHSANSEDVGRLASISLDYDSLSDENKSIAQDRGMTPEWVGDTRWVDIKVPVSVEDSIGDVSERLFAAQEGFVFQDVLYGTEPAGDCRARLQDYATGRLNIENPPDDIEELLAMINGENVYYAPEDRVFQNQELLDKHLLYLQSQR